MAINVAESENGMVVMTHNDFLSVRNENSNIMGK